MTTARRMTFEDLMQQPDDGCRHELVRGEIRRVPPPKGEHAFVEAALVGAIGRYLYGRAVALGWREDHSRGARARLVGLLGSGEGGMRLRLPDDPEQTRGADVLYLTPDEVARYGGILRDEYLPAVPALVAEVISPSERAADIQEKVADYMSGGAQLVWLLYPRTRTAHVYSPDGAARVLGPHETLDGGDVLPGFSVPIVSLFD